jgi:hypothetical protein
MTHSSSRLRIFLLVLAVVVALAAFGAGWTWDDQTGWTWDDDVTVVSP